MRRLLELFGWSILIVELGVPTMVSLRYVVDPYRVTLIWIPMFEWYMARLVVKTGWRTDTNKTCHLMIELCAQICSQHNSKKDLHDRLSRKTISLIIIFTMTSYNFHTSTPNVKLEIEGSARYIVANWIG